MTRRASRSPEDSQASTTPAGLGLDGAPIEVTLGRHATEAGPNPPAFRGPVPGCAAATPGTAASLPESPLNGSGAAQSTAGSTRSSAVLPAAWRRPETFDDAPLVSLRLRLPEPPPEAA